MTDNKYQRGKIYSIRCRTDDTLVYIGSTIDELRKRWNRHKQTSIKTDRQRNLFDVVDDNGGFENWYIELVENYPCNDKNELNRREGELIRQFGTLNKVIAGRTREEYREDNKEHLKQKKREWDLNNKELKAYHNKKYRKGEHRDKILERKREYYHRTKGERKKTS